MFRKTLTATAFVVACGSLAQAQDHRVEIAGTAGWTFSDGVSGNAVLVPGVGTFDRLDPKDAFSWGARIGFFVNEHVQVGGLFNLQSTQLEAGGSTTVTGQRRAVAAAMRETAELLGNTPTVARKSYVDSEVVDLYQRGVTIAVPGRVDDLAAAFADRPTWERAERAVRRLLT